MVSLIILAVVNLGISAFNVWIGFKNSKRGKNNVALWNMFAAGVTFAAAFVCILSLIV